MKNIDRIITQAMVKRHWDAEQSLWIDTLVDTNKFAELLIKECIRIDVENPDAAPGVEIAKYFGVE